MNFTYSEIEFALEQADILIENQSYEDWAKHAMICTTIANSQPSKNKKKYKTEDFIGKPPWEVKKAKQVQNRVEPDKDRLRKLAADKGIQVNF